MSRFQKALIKTFRFEGYLVDDPVDRGGLTKYGISQRAYPHLDITSLTRRQAEQIYYIDYWVKSKATYIESSPVAEYVFDMTVNSGRSNTGRILQRALQAHGYDIKVDGIVGEITIGCTNNCGLELLPTLRSERASFYRTICIRSPRQKRFLRGWLRRAYTY